MSYRSPADAPAGPRSGRPPRRRLRWIARTWWALFPVWSLGMLASVPFLRQAAVTRRRRDLFIFLGYLAASAAEIALVVVSRTDKAIGDLGGGLGILLIGVGSIHAWLIYTPRGTAIEESDDPNTLALTAAKTQIQRRAEARKILDHNPELARELKIGRPDLKRSYDDGGLIDVNHVSADVLCASLNWSRTEADSVVSARDGLGGFSSVEELSAYSALEPDRTDAVADLLIFRQA